jgi:hypothetical protein
MWSLRGMLAITPDVIVNFNCRILQRADIVYGLRRDRIQRKATLYNRPTKGFFGYTRQMTQEDLPLAASWILRLLSQRALNSLSECGDPLFCFSHLGFLQDCHYRGVSYDRLTRDASSRSASVLAAFSKR